MSSEKEADRIAFVSDARVGASVRFHPIDCLSIFYMYVTIFSFWLVLTCIPDLSRLEQEYFLLRFYVITIIPDPDDAP